MSLKIEARGDREIVMTRAFKAPAVLVFDTLTTPEALQEWLGVRDGWTMPECDFPHEIGGEYRFVWRNADGQSMGVRGVLREVEPPWRIVQTETFDEPWYPGEALVTHKLEEHADQTTLTTTVQYESTAARDDVLASPMATGVAESYDRLDELLAEHL